MEEDTTEPQKALQLIEKVSAALNWLLLYAGLAISAEIQISFNSIIINICMM